MFASAIGVLLCASLPATDRNADERPGAAGNPPCFTARSTDCGVSLAEMKQARELFEHGLHLKSAGRGDEALDSFERASQLVPRNVEFASAREITRQALILQHVQRGNNFLDLEKKVEAMAEFRSALELDPQNEFALQRLHDSFDLSPAPLSPGLRRVMDSAPIVMQPQPGTLDFHYVAISAANGLITVRAPSKTLAAAETLLTGLQNGPPQVLLDVKVFQVSRNALRNMGIGLPTQFQMFNLTSAALAAAVAGLGGGNTQNLINQLISGGGINQANSQAIQALLAQLQGQQNSILNTPF